MDAAQPHRNARLAGFQKLAIGTTALTLVLVALGGAVRATDSGLACPDWPRCFGAWIPPADLHMWLEHSHRLVAGMVGILSAVLAGWSLLRFRHRPTILWPALAALVLVVVQAGLGAVVVLRLLQAELVTAHLGMAMIVVACLLYLTVSISHPRDPAPASDLRFARLAAGVAGLAFVQILVGGHVTGIAAGLVYTDFPLMGGTLLPAVASEREAFHVAHRLLAYLLVAAVVLLCAAAVRHRRARVEAGSWSARERWLVTLPMWAATLVVLQIALGVGNLWTRSSALTVIPHLAVASWIWTLLALTTVLAHRWAPRASRVSERPGDRERSEA